MGILRKSMKLGTLGLAPIHYRDKQEREIKAAERSLDVQRKTYKEQVAGNRDRVAVAGDATSGDPIEDLERLGRLRDQGVLTPAEFEAQKAQILKQNGRRSRRR